MSKQQCPDGHENNAGRKYCTECGAPLTVRCRNGHLNAGTDRFCGECGVVLPSVDPGTTKQNEDADPTGARPERHRKMEINTPSKDSVAGGAGTSLGAEPPVSAERRTWYTRLPPRSQTLLSAALLVPPMLFFFAAWLFGPYDRDSRSTVIAIVTAAYGLYFLAVIAVAARSHTSRTTALAIGSMTIASDIVVGWFSVSPSYRGDLPKVAWALIFAAFLIAYIVTWGIARRQHKRWIWGLIPASVVVLTYGVGFGSSLITWGPLRAWLSSIGVFAVGSLFCWAFDYRARSKSRSGGGSDDNIDQSARQAPTVTPRTRSRPGQTPPNTTYFAPMSKPSLIPQIRQAVKSRPRAWGIGLGLTALVVVVLVVSQRGGFSEAEQKYLDALRSPCSHPEIYSSVASGNGNYCAFSWSASPRTLVDEGYRICALEEQNPLDKYRVPFDYISSQHPGYSQVQINTQLIAAEKLLC